jgi:hypothetical protein
MEQNNNSNSIKELAFVVPNEVRYEKDPKELDNIQLVRWHDLMHVFFKKLEDGLGEYAEFRWNFFMVTEKHSEIVHEMLMRGIHHYSPINNLDKIQSNLIVNNVYEKSEVISNEVKLSFEPPKNIEKKIV